jgi:4-azaleucine resistance transporter AzlC
LNSSSQFWRGVRAELPLVLSVVPFGMIYGVLALDAGLTRAQAQGMSAIVFAGSAQFITTQLVKSATPGFVIVLTILVVNLRHALYSASLAPYVQHLPLRWKLILSYLLTDEAYAPTISHYEEADQDPHKHWFFLGAGIALWTGWQLSTAAGITLGAVVPESWSLDFTLVLTFIALVVPRLRDRPSLASALVAGGAALIGFYLPYRLGILAAAVGGILAGTLLERKK